MTTRIVLDTCVVRAHVHATGERIDIAAIQEKKPGLSFSIGDAAFGELLLAILDERIEWAEWATAVADLAKILDTELPILPGGRELAEMAGLVTPGPPLLADTRSYYQAVWRLLSQAQSSQDLTDGIEFTDSKENRFRIRADKARAEAVLQHARLDWIGYIQGMQDRLTGSGLTQEQIAILILYGLEQGDKPPTDLPKLEEMARSIGRFVQLALATKTPYNPEADKRRGDVFDQSLLLSLALPATIVTNDTKLVNHLKMAGMGEPWKVMSVVDFNERVEAGTI